MATGQIHPSDDEIISLFLDRNEEAIKAVERIYGKYLFSTAYNILGDEEDSRECVNDALFLLWTHIPPDRPKCFKAYIARLTRNAALDTARKKNRKSEVPGGSLSLLDDLCAFLEDGSNVEKDYDRMLLKACLNKFLRGLDKRGQCIFVWRFYCFDSVEKIAGTLGVSQRQVYKDLTKMKTHLKEVLRKEGFFDA